VRAKTPELLNTIFEGIAKGISVRALCVETGIKQRQLWSWIAGDEELMRRYLRAKEGCIDRLAEEIKRI
jgi:hypothetical protein